MILKNFPHLHIEKIELAGEGMDSRSFFVKLPRHTYVFRFPKFPTVAKNLQVEMALLPKLQKYVRLPIPQFDFIGKGIMNRTFVGYKKIEGVTLTSLWNNIATHKQETILHILGAFLKNVHSFPVKEAKKCGVPEQNFRRIYKGDLRKVVKDIYLTIPQKMRVYIERLYEEYLGDERNFTYSPTLLHADFGGGHIFCNKHDACITGIIDFGDIGIGDPDYDLMYLYGEFGWKFILQFLKHYSRPDHDLNILHRKLRLLLIHNTIDDIWMGRDRKEKELETWAMGVLKRQVKDIQRGDFY